MKTYTLFAFSVLLSTKLVKLSASQRVKRFVWPPGGSKIQMIAGVGIPVDLRQETVIFGMVYKASYPLPTNVSQLSNTNTILQRKARSTEYTPKSTIEYFERFIYEQNQYSKPCVLRTICESASSYFDEHGGFMNEVMNIIFGSLEDTIKHHDDLDYIEAYELGIKRPQECKMIYSHCKSSLLDVISNNKDNSV